ncbi:uncharacterized protein LOC129582818 [Paramacrobiotus metropolitanus]|uniref:uncharacterized protein LOC129582818 n=1 Tax=Paramacrobiotus metropolitanus TaxID=2943436 RepID=UPI00244574EB|nr:uncharacterized protein LOC129582818 [Paramacrobiotus metropolitanus]
MRRMMELRRSFLWERDYNIAVHKRWLVDSAITDKSLIRALFRTALIDTWPGLLVSAVSVIVTIFIVRCLSARQRQYYSTTSVNQSLKNADSLRTLAMLKWITSILTTMQTLIFSFFSQVDIKRPRFAGAQLALLQWIIYSYFAICLMNAYVSSSLLGTTLTLPFHSLVGFARSGFDPLVVGTTASVGLMVRLRMQLRRTNDTV